MKTVNVTIEGTTPLLCNRFTEEAQQKAESGKGQIMVGDQGTPREQAEKKLYLAADGSGVWVIPTPNYLSCLIAAGKHMKVGRSKMTTQKSSLIPAILMVGGIELKIEAEGWEVDSRPIVNPVTGGRRPCHRPRFDRWRLSMSVEWDEEMMSTQALRSLFDHAGKKVGLGDFRPDRKGPFGKHKIVHWEVDK